MGEPATAEGYVEAGRREAGAAASHPDQAGPDLVMDVAELIWEPIAD